MLNRWGFEVAMHQRATSRSVSEEVRARGARGYDVPATHWQSFFKRFADRHRGALCRPGVGARKLPLHGAGIALRSDGSAEILVTLGEPPYMLEPYFVIDPVRVRVEADDDGGLSLALESSAGTPLRLYFDPSVGRSTGPLTLVG